MIVERSAAGVLVAATAAAATLPQPVIWHFLGYPFEAASLIAATFAAVTTRVVIGLRNRSVTYALDAAVLVLVLITAAAIVIGFRANLIAGLLYGTGFAAIGEGIIRLAERYTTKGLRALGVEPPPQIEDDHAAISDAMSKLNKID